MKVLEVYQREIESLRFEWFAGHAGGFIQEGRYLPTVRARIV
jgi:hypothetical protein